VFVQNLKSDCDLLESGTGRFQLWLELQGGVVGAMTGAASEASNSLCNDVMPQRCAYAPACCDKLRRAPCFVITCRSDVISIRVLLFVD
jgi:hypothetical protein